MAMLIILHLTLGNTRPDRITTNSITSQQMLILHQALLHWLVMGTPPDLYNLQCLNTNIDQISSISIPEHLTRCNMLQLTSLPR